MEKTSGSKQGGQGRIPTTPTHHQQPPHQSPQRYWLTWLSWVGTFIHVASFTPSTVVQPKTSWLKRLLWGSAFAILHDLDVLFGFPRITGDKDESHLIRDQDKPFRDPTLPPWPECCSFFCFCFFFFSFFFFFKRGRWGGSKGQRENLQQVPHPARILTGAPSYDLEAPT